MSNFPKNQKIHSHLIKQPSFKHSLMVALIVSLGGTSLATWAGETQTTSSAVPITAAVPHTREQLTPEQRAERHAQRQQERTEHRTEAFQQADANHDGKVNLTEWLAFKPQHHGPKEGQRPDHGGKNLVEWLQKVDSNHDGKISKAEAESYAPRLAKHFAEIDSNHDGLLSQDELNASFEARKAKWQERSIKERTEAFQKADTDHDGQLTLTEWLAFKPQHHGFWHNIWHRWFGHDHRHHHKGPRGDFFKKVDTNNDGQISLSEAQANAPRLAEHFNEIDTDHNGQISQDERRAAFKAANAKAAS